MQHRYTVKRRSTHVEIEFADRLVAEAIVTILDEIAWHEIRASKRGLLWDLRRADLSAYRIEDMARLRAYDSEEANRVSVPPPEATEDRPFRIAAVFEGDANHLILRLWESSADLSDNLERRSFDRIDEARRWVVL